MPSARQGDIRWYQFGPVIGAELSGYRPALIISRDDVNRHLQMAIALPTSTTMPAEEFRTQHVRITPPNPQGRVSWASAWQVKSVVQRDLGDLNGRASPDELDQALEELLARLDDRRDPGQIETSSGTFPIGAGTLWNLPLTEPGRGEFSTTVLVLDYNAGNNMAITVDVDWNEPSTDSPVAVPVTILRRRNIVSARVHVVRSIDASCRRLRPVGAIRPEDVDATIYKLRTLL